MIYACFRLVAPRDLALAVLFLALTAAVRVESQNLAAPESAPAERYEFRTAHDPDGIGKFYHGREIARVMGETGADWLERPERSREENSERMLRVLKVKPGDFVADIGAGTGFYSRRLAPLVGAAGKVFAEDIQPEMLVILTNKATALGLSNIVPVLGTPTNPMLPAESLNLVLLVDVYHEFDFPSEMMQAICRALKPGGRVAFVEFRGEDPAVAIKPLHKMSEKQVKMEMAGQPLEWAETIETLPWQHIVIFKKRSPQKANRTP